jgi:hypothetical protein
VLRRDGKKYGYARLWGVSTETARGGGHASRQERDGALALGACRLAPDVAVPDREDVVIEAAIKALAGSRTIGGR